MRTILFEPWSLGDVVIATAVIRELSYRPSLACHPAWHRIVRAALPEKPDLDLIPVDLPYTTRQRSHPLEFSKNVTGAVVAGDASVVLSIRGDFRDYMAARKLFPKARVRMTGWIRFLARKNSIVDFPYSRGLLPVENRYDSWANLLGIPIGQVASTYLRKQASAPRNRRVVIHMGAQWRSKQFPHVHQLCELLQNRGYQTVLAAGASDLLPPSISPEAVTRVEDAALVELFRSAEHVVTNDSGPMHVSAFVGCRTTVIARTASIEEWIPPATQLVASELTPGGYRQRRNYMTDQILHGWPTALKVVKTVTQSSPRL